MAPASIETCYPHQQYDDLSTCDGLLSHFTLQFYIWIVALISLIGNIVVFIVHAKKRKSKKNQVPSFLIANLAVADFSVGIYLTIIAVSDRIYSYSDFAEESEGWLRSKSCLIACFICCAASMMSVFMMLIISIDRYICIVYPFSERKLNMKKATILVASFWLYAIVFVGIPVFYSIDKEGDNQLHGHSSICMASNVMNPYFKWWLTAYTFITIICWIITCVLYSIMLNSIRKTRQNVRKNETNKDLRIAIRLFLILITDLVSWIPYYIVFMQVLSKSALVDILTLQFVIIIALPINSAVNPCLYTISSQSVIYRANSISAAVRRAYQALIFSTVLTFSPISSKSCRDNSNRGSNASKRRLSKSYSNGNKRTTIV